MPYKDKWKRTEAVRRFRLRQRQQRHRSREASNSRASSPTGPPADGGAPPQGRAPTTWLLWGISALTVLAAVAARKSPSVYEGPPGFLG